jgi:hypothetical protein
LPFWETKGGRKHSGGVLASKNQHQKINFDGWVLRISLVAKNPLLRFSQASKYVQHIVLWKFMLYLYLYARFLLTAYSPRREPKATFTSNFEQQQMKRLVEGEEYCLSIILLKSATSRWRLQGRTSAYLHLHVLNKTTKPTRSVATHPRKMIRRRSTVVLANNIKDKVTAS